jgi:hypothetical protein
MMGARRKGKFIRQYADQKGYIRSNTSIDAVQVHFFAHRVAAEVSLEDYSEHLQVDHKNGIKDDNRPCNLKMVTNAQNQRSFLRMKKNTASKYRGVSLNKKLNKWRSRIMVDGKGVHLGYFTSEEAAATAYDRGAMERDFGSGALNINNNPELSMLAGA